MNISAIIEGDFQGGGLQDFDRYFDSRFFRNKVDDSGYLDISGHTVEVKHTPLMIHTSQLYDSGKAFRELRHGSVIVCVPHSLVGSRLDLRLSSHKTCDKKMNVYTIVPEFWDGMEVPENVKVIKSNFIPLLEKVYELSTHQGELEEKSACIFINRSELPNKYLKQYSRMVEELRINKIYFKLHPTEPKEGSEEQVKSLSEKLGVEVELVDSKVDPYHLADKVKYSLVGYTSLRVELWLRYNFHFKCENKVISLQGSYRDEIPSFDYDTVPVTRYDNLYAPVEVVSSEFKKLLREIAEKEGVEI